MAQTLSVTSVIESASKLPFVHISREEFIVKNLSKLCTAEQLQKAIKEGTLRAGIPITILDSVANSVINAETIKVTSISAAAGLPGGFAMAASIPADLAQFYGFVIRIAQELAYIYGWDEILPKSNSLDAESESQLVLFIGVMSGVSIANKVVGKLFGEAAMRAVSKKVAAKALTKTWYYPMIKKIAAMLGQKIVKSTFAKGVSKTVPIIGGAISGGLTFATFKPMAHKLKNHLSTLARMSPEEYSEYEASIVIDVDESETVDETVGVETEVSDNSYWICDCGRKNKSKFCPECGKAKPAVIPQYKCNKCGWMPDDVTNPPNFCPECGDPFDDDDKIIG